MPKITQEGTMTEPDGGQYDAAITYDPTEPGMGARVTPVDRSALPESILRQDGEDTISLIRRRRDARGGYTSGFCLDAVRLEPLAGRVALARDPDEWHKLCRGAVTNGAGKTSLCLCPCHDAYPVCHECKQPYAEVGLGYDAERRRCTDRGACAERIAEAHRVYEETNESVPQIAAKPAKRAADPGDAPEGPARAVSATKAPRKATKGVPQRCHCGCGAMTKGGRFSMGHDMKLKGRLFEAARTGLYTEASRAAADEIVARGWNETGISAECLAEARAKDPMGVIRAAVTARYDGVEGEVA